jgi:hypothetical protein
MCCNPVINGGRVDFEDGWLKKSSFKTKEEHEACQLTRTKVQQQQKKNNNSKPKFKWLIFMYSTFSHIFEKSFISNSILRSSWCSSNL